MFVPISPPKKEKNQKLTFQSKKKIFLPLHLSFHVLPNDIRLYDSIYLCKFDYNVSCKKVKKNPIAIIFWKKISILRKTTYFRGSPVDSILEAVFTVSPNRQNLGIFRPTTPEHTGPLEKFM